MSAHDTPPNATNHIRIRGARTHNLRDVSLEIPTRVLTVLTGPSGCGKSSLAVDSIAAEAEFRVQQISNSSSSAALSTRPPVTRISNLPPTILVQPTRRLSNVHTIASLLELDGVVARGFTTHGRRVCPRCTGTIRSLTLQEIADAIAAEWSGALIAVLAPFQVAALQQGGAARIAAQGISRFFIEGEERRLESEAEITDAVSYLSPHTQVELVVDRLRVEATPSRRLWDSLHLARDLGDGECAVRALDGGASRHFSTQGRCSACGYRSFPIVPALFDLKIGGSDLLRGLTLLSPEQQQELLHYTWHEVALHTLLHSRIDQLPTSTALANAPEFSPAVELLRDLGLGHLTLSRPIAPLATGERQRLALARQVQLSGANLLYVLDEPSSGLHLQDAARLLPLLKRLRANGNTIIMTEHNPLLQHAADHEVALGPGSGTNGGTITYQGPVRPRTDWVLLQTPHPTAPRPAPLSAIEIEDLAQRNVRVSHLQIPCGRVTGLIGLSGSGKSTLARAIFDLTREARGLAPRPMDLEIKRFEIPDEIRSPSFAPLLEGAPSGSSVVASYIDLLDPLRTLFASLPLSGMRGYTKASFSLSGRQSLRCAHCAGVGTVGGAPCSVCGGLRFRPELAEVRFKHLSFGELLSLSTSEALEVLQAIPKCAAPLKLLCEVQLGYLLLGQSTASLSAGELQRLRVVRALRQPAGALLILDEPTRGLGGSEIESLMQLFSRLADAGGTVLLVEHHPAAIMRCDHLIELGPGAGEDGGKVVFRGPPSELLQSSDSPTARAFRTLLPS